ncbi:MAG: histidine--tRNA ligase [Candidatus Doudnabacteria bacterium]|nr:histidine--tRNA ligase [Candidatus Doudnabacteria bacterium]
MQLSNQPPKGTADWLPEEFKIRKYIFDTWRKVCESFGYEEYLTPIVESAEIYRAKSGEDVGGKELMTMVDRGGRELAIRPEMTPSVTRMVSRQYGAVAKPIRYFSIANFLRNENPQRGRNREFWQLNADIFGSDSVNADIEVLQLALEIMLAFNPPKDSFALTLNHRLLIDAVLVVALSGDSSIERREVVRLLDKWEKIPPDGMAEMLQKIGVEPNGVDVLQKFMTSETVDELLNKLPWLSENDGLKQVQAIVKKLQELGYADWVRFQPNIIRGFDYYDGMVFEVFDRHPDNNRAMFGGGRYNGLASLFGGQAFPAVGFAPGDETTRIFLESWGLLDQVRTQKTETRVFIPLLTEQAEGKVAELAAQLRKRGQKVLVGLEIQKIGKAIELGDKLGVGQVIILGEDELQKGVYVVKEMQSGEQTEVKL